jgi:hypothetical protein
VTQAFVQDYGGSPLPDFHVTRKKAQYLTQSLLLEEKNLGKTERYSESDKVY